MQCKLYKQANLSPQFDEIQNTYQIKDMIVSKFYISF